MANYELVNADQLDSDLTAVGNAIRSKGGTSAKLSFPSGMVSAIGAISTGVELNFDVVGGTSQPSNPKENTIWVNTSTAITDWIFSSTQPAAQAGRVWISTGTSSPVEYNALKKNGIQVYPISAKQYVSGAWVDRTAKSYQSGKWVDWWNGELFDNGDQYTAITGGWVKKSGMKCYDNANTGTATVGNTLHIASSAGTASVLTTKNKIDITRFSTMKINVTNVNGALLSLHAFEAGNINKGVMIKWLTTGENVLDLTEDGEFYVSVGANSGNGCDVSEIEMY